MLRPLLEHHKLGFHLINYFNFLELLLFVSGCVSCVVCWVCGTFYLMLTPTAVMSTYVAWQHFAKYNGTSW